MKYLNFDCFTHSAVFATVGLSLVLLSCSHQVPQKTELTAPTCYSQTETCRDAWFEYGDATGDYGVVDAAE